MKRDPHVNDIVRIRTEWYSPALLIEHPCSFFLGIVFLQEERKSRAIAMDADQVVSAPIAEFGSESKKIVSLKILLPKFLHTGDSIGVFPTFDSSCLNAHDFLHRSRFEKKAPLGFEPRTT